MKKFKGTPGPWAYSLYEREGLGECCLIHQEEGAPYTKFYSDVGQTCYGENPEVQEANAHLIAAAPELLEALDDLIHLAESAMLRANYDGGEYDIDGELSDARAAIAKALGEDV